MQELDCTCAFNIGNEGNIFTIRRSAETVPARSELAQ